MSPAEDRARLVRHLRRHGIADERVLAAIAAVPRERFVPPDIADRAYDDTALPIGDGQTISQPFVVAHMAQALMTTPLASALEIGTGSGYNAAVLARLCRRVVTIERSAPLLDGARRHLAALGVTNVETRLGDGTRGWPAAAPFDRLIVTAAAIELPERLLGQLAPHGIAVVPVGPAGWVQRLVRVVRRDGRFVSEHLGDVRFVPLLPGGIGDDKPS